MKTKRKLSYRNQVHASFLLVALVPLAILGVFAYHTYLSELTEKIDVSLRSTAVQTRNRVDNALLSIKEYYGQEFQKNDEHIQWLMGSEIAYQNQYRLQEISKKMRGPLSLIQYTNGFSFFNIKHDWAVTSLGMYRLHEAGNLEELNALLEANDQPGQRMFWINHMQRAASAVVSSKNISLEGYLLCIRLPVIGVDTDAVLLVNLDSQQLARLAVEGTEGYETVVIDGEGGLFSASNSALARYCAEHAKALSEGGGIQVADLENGESYRVAVARSAASDLTYITGYSNNLVAEGAERIMTLFWVLAAVVVLLLILSRVGAKFLYKPIDRLVTYMGDSAAGAGGSNEFERFERGVEALVDSRQETLRELFVLRLLRGELGEDAIRDTMDRLGLTPFPCYAVMAVRFAADLDNGDSTLGEDALQIAVAEELPPAVRQLLYAPPVTSSRSLVLAVAGTEEYLLNNRLGELYRQLAEYAGEAFGSTALAGVSRTFSDLSQFRTAYHESVEALKNNGTGGDARENLVFYSDISASVPSGIAYNTLAEREIQAALDRCDYEKAAACSDRFMDDLRERGVALHEQRLHLYRFLIAILLVPDTAGLSINEIYKEQEENLFLSMTRIYDLEEMKEYFKSTIIRPGIRALEQFRENQSPKILEQVLDLVKERRGNITLAECADLLGYHPSHIWKVLKAQRDMTFTDFVAWEKLQIAKEMLLTTDLPVAEIAESLNYTNAQNFIRFFSKHEGTTPGKFRKAAGSYGES